MKCDEESEEEPKSCVEALSFHLEDKYYNIESIYLNNCKISDESAVMILSTLLFSSNQKLHKLYLN